MAARTSQFRGDPGRMRWGVALVISVALTGCFGPPTMHYDIQAYNRAVVSSEQEMLLFNMGRLLYDQPPHFMMLSEVDQTRVFSASSSFQWTHLWNSLFIPLGTTSITSKGSDTYQVGPFAAASSENPTVKFIPIQGSDFAQRFESSLTDKLSLFLEDQRWYATRKEREEMFLLFVQGLDLLHGDEAIGGNCHRGFYFSRPLLPEELNTVPGRSPLYDDTKLALCVHEIIDSAPNFERIEGNYLFPTSTSEPPKAADVVSALQVGLNWTTNGRAYLLANPVKIPAYLDYVPWYPPSPPADQRSSNLLSPLWWLQKDEPKWDKVDSSKLPKNYQWELVTDKNETAQHAYALVPDGYDLERDRGGYKLVRLNAIVPRYQEPLWYSNEIVRYVWPVPQDYFYVELRNKSDGRVAERMCFAPFEEKGYKSNSVICGYFKIGNFLQIMSRLAKSACTEDCSKPEFRHSVVAIGEKVPDWADSSASYTYPTEEGVEKTEKIWVPAHDPKRDPGLAARDRRVFFSLYKLYQMSLVDTSKLVTGTTPITISK